MTGVRGISRIAFRNLFRNRSRTVFCILAVAFAAFINIQGAGMWEGIFSSWRHAAYVFDIGHLRIGTREFLKKSIIKPLRFPLEPAGTDLDGLIAAIEAVPGVRRAFPRMETEATPLQGEIRRLHVWGLRFAEETRANVFNYRLKSDGLEEGRIPGAGTDECMIGKGLAAETGLKIGDRVPMTFIGAENRERYIDPEIVGIFDFDFFLYNNDFVVLDFGYLQEAAGLRGKTQTVSVFVEESSVRGSAAQRDLRTKIRNLFTDDRVVVESWMDADSLVLTDVRVFKIIITILYAIFNLMAGFLILNTISMVLIERSREIGLMSSLGMGKGSILLVFFLEGAYLGLIGTVIGMAIGGMEVFVLSGVPIDISIFFGAGELPYSATFYFLFDLGIIAFYGFQSFMITAACSVLPVLKVLKVNPADSMRE